MAAVEKRGLGKGLGALIVPAVPAAPGQHQPSPPPIMPFMAGRTIVQLDVAKIVPNTRQPRKTFDTHKMEELTESVKEQGIMQPILVRRRGDQYEIIAGERRFRAGSRAGLKTVPVIIKEFTDEQSLEIAIVENLQREDLNPVEEALAYKALAEEFKLTHDQIAKKVGKERSTITNSLRLLELPKQIVESISMSEITPGHARPLLGIPDEVHRIDIWKQIVENDLSVRDVESLLSVISDKKPALKKKKRQKDKDRVLVDYEENLSGKLATKVEIHGTSQKGRILINYYSQEDLERIIEEITK